MTDIKQHHGSLEIGILPLLTTAFCSFTVISIGRYVDLLYAGWEFPPWLAVVIVIAALESVYFSAFILSPRTPFLLRIVEILFYVIIVYVLRRLFGPQVEYGWAKISSAVLDPAVILPCLLVLVAWSMAGGYGWQFSKMKKLADQLGDQAASTVSWEYESLETKDGTQIPIEFFLARFFGYGLVIVILAIAAVRSGAASELTLSGRIRFWTLGIGTLLSGLCLQGSVYLFRLQAMWKHTRVRVSSGLVSSWMRNLLLFVAVLVLAAGLMPVNYSPLTYDRLASYAGYLIARFTDGPVDLELDLGPSESVDTPQIEWSHDQEEAPSFWMALVAFLYIVFIVGGLFLVLFAAIGFMIVVLAKDEIEKLRGLPKLMARVYMVFASAVRYCLTNLKGLWRRVEKGWQNQKRLARGDQSDEMFPEDGQERDVFSSRATHIRQMFRQIVRAGKKGGIAMKRGHTPTEYGETLHASLPDTQQEIEHFFAEYNRARYSKVSAQQPRMNESVGQAGRHIIKQLKRLGRKREEL